MTNRSGPIYGDFIADALLRPLEVVFQDDHYVAAYKPAGLMVHRGPRTTSSEPAMLQALRDQLDRFLYPIHRLDRPTAGLVLFGFTSDAAARMGEMFACRRIAKHYQALVRGFIEEDRSVTQSLVAHGKEANDSKYPLASANLPEVGDGLIGQVAITHFRRLRHYEINLRESENATSEFALLEIQPVTGRWHQIRRHLSMISHPVIGDHLHGDPILNQMFSERTGVYRMLLTAMRLDFRHPYTDEATSILVPRGEAFDEALRNLNSIP